MADLAPEPVLASAQATLTHKRWWFLLGLFLSVMVSGLSSVCMKQLLLPIQTSQLAPGFPTKAGMAKPRISPIGKEVIV